MQKNNYVLMKDNQEAQLGEEITLDGHTFILLGGEPPTSAIPHGTLFLRGKSTGEESTFFPDATFPATWRPIARMWQCSQCPKVYTTSRKAENCPHQRKPRQLWVCPGCQQIQTVYKRICEKCKFTRKGENP